MVSESRKIIIVDDEASQRDLLAGFLAKHDYQVTTFESGEKALTGYHEVFAPLVILDLKMSGIDGLTTLRGLRETNPFLQAIVLTAFGSVETAVEAMRAGAFDYLTKPLEDLEELLVKLDRAARQNRLIVDYQVMSDRLAEVFPSSEIIGESDAMRRVKEMISLVAPKDATVMITGPSGTGKELVARALHALSPRAERRLVAINCAAFPETLLESELFGHERGAFTGADAPKQGRFELAEGGTLFLDEIAEMPLTMQVKLLRVLEDRRVQRLGSVKDIALDLRVIAATNRDLEEEIKAGRFREDLYYRLNVIVIKLPPLKERAGDAMLLANAFIERFSRKLGKDITGLHPDAAELLSRYSWPGNVRELENVIERAGVLCRGNLIRKQDLAGLSTRPATTDPGQQVRSLADVEKEHILFCLNELDWNMTLTAERLGIHRNTLRAKIKEYDLKRE